MDYLLPLSYITTVTGGILLWILEGVIPFFANRKARGTHAAGNLSIAGVNLLILLPAGILMAGILEQSKSFWPGIRSLDLPVFVQTIVIILLIDLWMYSWHRMNHTVDFLWRFHAVHHSDPSMDVTTAWRFHYVEILFSEMLRLPVFILIGAGIQEILIYSMLMTPVIEFHHSNISISSSTDRLLRTVIPTPMMHRVHHSVVREEHDSNYGSMLSFWDRFFGSFKSNIDIRNLTLGLQNESSPEQQHLAALLKRPFHNL
ncbi:MAG: sterol desaturase family protein [Chlorobium phaeobacteroides]|uniref:Fatty acid hydroxylase n=1 Tax=Chlorobium phaeobacteroides (strain BS1) TaxID=331678 RepID=B3EQM1_CHLPB|nr:sterol desaturase family protein [Chlorobium phaeobacteroides]MBL6956426.1 sterol desaturase family protein [Chlorobium phaeobacteroides]